MTLNEKYKSLREFLTSLNSAAVAFSGGVDSTLLLRVAHDVLGDKAIAVTVSASFTAGREMTESEEFCCVNKIRQFKIHVDETEIDGFTDNPPNRCYLCKHALFSRIFSKARENGISNVIDGSNLDDLGDYRPGMKALDELGVVSPLRHCGFTKNDVRGLSRELGLPTWNKPSFACLASRFVYGEKITREKLRMVERSEDFLMSLGFSQLRVRVHGDVARIEVIPSDFPKILEERERIYDLLKSFGFSYVALDLKGYRTGSMNEQLDIHA